ncbi:MAG: hypothetical protein FWF76_03985 [Oscillospiraceae bacterium]|nr:hypothetical protein [Oscillospiraceae bacterium]
MNTPIYNFLKNHAKSGALSCHTPGHKGIIHPFDITEIDGAVDIIEQSERNASKLFGAARTLFSCSGSTLSIFAMLASVMNSSGVTKTKRITAFRGAHRSLIDAAILLDFEIDWITPHEFVVSNELLVTENTVGVFATSIDYYGNMVDIDNFSWACQKYNLPLLVDNAHGAYQVITGGHPIDLGATMSVDSAHKTLPALTGAAYLHIADKGLHLAQAAEDAMKLFGTTSPSYLILASLDLCNHYIAQKKQQPRDGWNEPTPLSDISWLKSELRKRSYVIDERMCYNKHSFHLSVRTDPLRIVIDVNAYGYSGSDYAVELKKHGIIPEMYDSKYVILLFSTITSHDDIKYILRAMSNIPKKSAIYSSIDYEMYSSIIPKQALSAKVAFFSQKKMIKVTESVGEICAEIRVTVPPCVPFILPGEVISPQIAEILLEIGIKEIAVVK